MGESINAVINARYDYGIPAEKWRTHIIKCIVCFECIKTKSQNECRRDRKVIVFTPEAKLRATLERLTEAGLIEAIGSNRGRTYVLSAKMYHDPVKYRSFQGRQENESPATAVRQPEPQVNGCLVTAIADRGKLNID